MPSCSCVSLLPPICKARGGLHSLIYSPFFSLPARFSLGFTVAKLSQHYPSINPSLRVNASMPRSKSNTGSLVFFHLSLSFLDLSDTK